MATKKIRSVEELLESLKGTPFIEDTSIYRGQIDRTWEIIPSLLRQTVNEKPKIIELTLFAPLYQDKNIPFLETKDPLEFLTILQHYGIKTRLLDWSKDPLVALFFACFEENPTKKDGTFIVTDKRNFPNVTLKSAKHEFFVSNYKDLPNDKYKNRINNSEIEYFEPVFSNPRSRCQNGCFLFYPFSTFKETDTKYVNLEDYIGYVNKHNKEQNSDKKIFIAKIDIDNNYKKSILSELEIKHSISYESLMLPNLTTTIIEQEFKLLLDRILASYPEIENIYRNLFNSKK